MPNNLLPDVSVAALEMIIEYLVLGSNALLGENVTAMPEYEIVPGTKVAPLRTVKLLALSVAGSIASLKKAPILVLVATPVEPSALIVEVIVGGVVSETLPVVKLHT